MVFRVDRLGVRACDIGIVIVRCSLPKTIKIWHLCRSKFRVLSVRDEFGRIQTSTRKADLESKMIIAHVKQPK